MDALPTHSGLIVVDVADVVRVDDDAMIVELSVVVVVVCVVKVAVALAVVKVEAETLQMPQSSHTSQAKFTPSQSVAQYMWLLSVGAYSEQPPNPTSQVDASLTHDGVAVQTPHSLHACEAM